MMWATPFLQLQKPSSHGFRPGFQAGEVPVGLRYLFSTRQEWPLPLVVAKIDIAKAYDTVSWNAIQRMFIRRNLPPALQAHYWRVHRHRSLLFTTADRRISFRATPTCGMPQGSPETPLVCAALVEDAITAANQRMHLQQGYGCKKKGGLMQLRAPKIFDEETSWVIIPLLILLMTLMLWEQERTMSATL